MSDVSSRIRKMRNAAKHEIKIPESRGGRAKKILLQNVCGGSGG